MSATTNDLQNDSSQAAVQKTPLLCWHYERQYLRVMNKILETPHKS